MESFLLRFCDSPKKGITIKNFYDYSNKLVRGVKSGEPVTPLK